MTFKEFRANERLVAEAAALKTNNTFRLILEILDAENPNKIPPEDTSIEGRAIHQSIGQGYQRAISILNLVSKKIVVAKENVVSNNYNAKPLPEIKPPVQPVDLPPVEVAT